MNMTAEPKRAVRPETLEGIYRSNVGGVTAFFGRRCSDPQMVADLTAETFLHAVRSFPSFDPRRGSSRAWLFGIARHVYADHRADIANGRHVELRLAAQITLGDDEIEQLAARIDDQHRGRKLLGDCARLPEIDRVAIELVDLSGLSIKEAAAALNTSPGALRVRLFRARARLRKGV